MPCCPESGSAGLEDRPSEKVVKAIAAAESIDATDIREPLFEVINPEALNSLFVDSECDAGRVAFDYRGYRVVVTHTGTIELDATLVTPPHP